MTVVTFCEPVVTTTRRSVGLRVCSTAPASAVHQRDPGVAVIVSRTSFKEAKMHPRITVLFQLIDETLEANDAAMAALGNAGKESVPIPVTVNDRVPAWSTPSPR